VDSPVPAAICCGPLAGFVVGAKFDGLSYIRQRYHGRRAYGRVFGEYAVSGGPCQRADFCPALLVRAGLCIGAGILFSLLGLYR
jgi:hypothetical protein